MLAPFGRLLDRRGDLVERGRRLLEARRLLLGAARQIVGSRGDLLGARGDACRALGDPVIAIRRFSCAALKSTRSFSKAGSEGISIECSRLLAAKRDQTRRRVR